MQLTPATASESAMSTHLNRRFRVMIVDDDRLAVDDLKRLVEWVELDCIIVAEARNGRDALTKARDVHPDIVIADIRMPVMDGLQLAEELLRLNPCTRVLLLTAFRDFSYARQAVRLGVCSFVLKNEMDGQKLTAEIRAMQRSWFRVTREHGAARRESLKWYTLSLARGATTGDVPAILVPGGSVAAILFCVDSPLSTILPPLVDSPLPTDNDIAARTPRLDVIDEFEITHLHSNVYLAIARFERVFGANDLRSYAKSLVRSIRKTIREHTNLGSVAVYEIVDCNDGRRIAPSFQELFEIAAYRYSFSRDTCVYLGDFQEETVDTSVLSILAEYETGLIAAIRNQNDADVVQVEEHIMSLVRRGCITEQILVRLFEFYIHVIEQVLIGSATVSTTWSVRDVFRGLLHPCNRSHDLSGILFSLYRTCIPTTGGGPTHRYCMRVRKAIRFIEAHYQENIGVPDMAAIVGLSVPRFSALFRSETGLSPAAFLADFRIERACRLLVESTMRIGEIAAATGYSSAQYFSRVLREHTGKTPVEYREEHSLK